MEDKVAELRQQLESAEMSETKVKENLIMATKEKVRIMYKENIISALKFNSQ